MTEMGNKREGAHIPIADEEALQKFASELPLAVREKLESIELGADPLELLEHYGITRIPGTTEAFDPWGRAYETYAVYDHTEAVYPKRRLMLVWAMALAAAKNFGHPFASFRITPHIEGSPPFIRWRWTLYAEDPRLTTKSKDGG